MKPIQMVDLVSQYNKIKPEVDRAVEEVMNTAAFINGPEVQAFKSELQEYLNVKHVIPCANGTDALQVAMMGLELKPGDEVIVPTFTYVATAEVIALLQLTPVLVDVDPDTFMIDPLAVEAAITSKTKAIVPVHLFGQCADMDTLMAIAEKHDLFVVEDTAQAIGADYTFANGKTHKAGTIGNIGATSFFPSKNLGCFGDGGAIFTNDEALAAKMTMIVNHGQSKRYYHDSIGVNSRLDSIQAAVLRIKLGHLNTYNTARKNAADAYDAIFKNHPMLTVPSRAENSTHVFHQYTLKLKGANRNELKAHMDAKGIPCMIYYPVALHMQSAYKDDRYAEGAFPVTEDLCEQVFSLPMHSELEDDQITLITSSVLEFLNK